MGTMIRYHGPFDAVEVSGMGIVERMKPVEVETELAKRLLLQEDNWQRPPKPKSTTPAANKAPAEGATKNKEGDN